MFLARSLDGGQRHKAPRLINIERLPSTPLAVHHEVAIPQVVGAAEGIALGNAPAQGVIGVAGGLDDSVARGVRFDELVVCVPGQVQHFLGAGLLVAACAAGDVAVQVVFKVQVLVEAQAVVADHAQGGVHGLAVFAGMESSRLPAGSKAKSLRASGLPWEGRTNEFAHSPNFKKISFIKKITIEIISCIFYIYRKLFRI